MQVEVLLRGMTMPFTIPFEGNFDNVVLDDSPSWIVIKSVEGDTYTFNAYEILLIVVRQ